MARRVDTAEFLGIKLQLDTESQKANTIDAVRLFTQMIVLAAIAGGAVFLFRRTPA